MRFNIFSFHRKVHPHVDLFIMVFNLDHKFWVKILQIVIANRQMVRVQVLRDTRRPIYSKLTPLSSISNLLFPILASSNLSQKLEWLVLLYSSWLTWSPRLLLILLQCLSFISISTSVSLLRVSSPFNFFLYYWLSDFFSKKQIFFKSR